MQRAQGGDDCFAFVLSRYVAPITEETLKAIYIVVVLRQRRLGFLVDAAVLGFAVGTGFAVIENIDYLRRLRGQGLVLWVVRGFGPALLHGTSTALFAILAKNFTDRRPERWRSDVAGALGVAIVFHSIFNHFPMPPIMAACVLLVVLPTIVTVVFERSEMRATRDWLGVGLDSDLELLESIASGQALETRLGEYLLRSRGRAASGRPKPTAGSTSNSPGHRSPARVELELSRSNLARTRRDQL